MRFIANSIRYFFGDKGDYRFLNTFSFLLFLGIFVDYIVCLLVNGNIYCIYMYPQYIIGGGFSAIGLLGMIVLGPVVWINLKDGYVVPQRQLSLIIMAVSLFVSTIMFILPIFKII